MHKLDPISNVIYIYYRFNGHINKVLTKKIHAIVLGLFSILFREGRLNCRDTAGPPLWGGDMGADQKDGGCPGRFPGQGS